MKNQKRVCLFFMVLFLYKICFFTFHTFANETPNESSVSTTNVTTDESTSAPPVSDNLVDQSIKTSENLLERLMGDREIIK